MRRAERILIAIGLAVIAAAILYETLHAPDLAVSSAPQTQATSAVLTSVSRFAVDLNTASREELLGVRGIREELADAIVRDRAENGRFNAVEEITRVPGIGPATMEKLRPYLTVQ